MFNDSPSDFLSCIVTSREGSNPGMDTEVWRQALTATRAAAPSAMAALVGRAWAASPPDVVTTVTSVTQSTIAAATVGAGAMQRRARSRR
eukprot:3695464-Prymnesium_polylepis.1